MVRRIAVMVLLGLSWASAAHGQSVEVYGSAGPTIFEAGNSVAAGLRLSPGSRLTLVISGERTHQSDRISDADGVATALFRGSTLLLGTVELQVVPRGRERLGPYALAGVAAGRSRLSDTSTSSDRLNHDARAIFFGAGVNMPVGDRVTVFGDWRLVLGSQGIEQGLVAAPLRAGVAWRLF